jgi:hypothetical protein
MRRWALIGAVVVFVLGALLVVRPFIAYQHDQPSEIPSPASLLATDTVQLRGGQQACFAHAVAEHHSEILRYKVSSPAGPAPEMRVRIFGGGYDYTATIPPGLLDTQTAQAAMPAPPADLPVTVCIANQGPQAVGLFASSDLRSRSRSIAVIGRKSTQKSIWFAFYEPAPRAITERIPATIERMTVFRPHWVKPWLLWIIAVLFLAGTPIAVVWAYLRALREDGVDDLRAVDVDRRRAWWRRYVD